ncbi:MAG: M50 family metallopeptidase [Myxococcota bacterium]
MHVVWSILGLSALIVIHELGHFWVARLFDMRVLRFSLGFGPPLLSIQRGETQWQIAALPLGGFVQVDGMGLREDDVVSDERNYRNKPAWQRAAVVFAGPLINWLLAAGLVAALGVTAGVQRTVDTATIGLVAEDSPAAAAGLEVGDRVLSVDGRSVADRVAFEQEILSHAEQEMTLVVDRNGQELTLTATPKRAAQGGVLGIGWAMERVHYGPIESLGAGFRYAWDGSGRLVGLLWGMLVGTQSGELSGLPGIFNAVSTQAKAGLDRLVQTLAWLSVTLCVLNLAPFPALDGGRLAFLAFEATRGRPAPEKLEATVNGVGMMLLLGLMLFLFVRDLVQ